MWPAASGWSPESTCCWPSRLVGALWWAWGYFLAARLTSPVEAAAESRKVRASNWVDRLYPATPAGGVAARSLRYWRRDPRYLAGIAGFMVAPVIIIVTQVTNPDGLPELAAFAPALIGWLVGVSVAQDLSYDGSAFWLHVSSGLRGADDRAGRVWAAITVVFLPVTVMLFVAACHHQRASGSCWRRSPGVTVGLMLSRPGGRIAGRRPLAVAGPAAGRQPVPDRQQRRTAGAAVLHRDQFRHVDRLRTDDRAWSSGRSSPPGWATSRCRSGW